MTKRTRYGSYKFLVMLFGLCNMSATFMSIMNKIIYEEIDECVVLYIDDMLIYFKSELDEM